MSENVAPTGRCCCFTGHRPDDIGGYDETGDQRVWIRQYLGKAVDVAIAQGFTRFATGGALGVDTDAAEVVLAKRDALRAAESPVRITLTVCGPYQGFYAKWPKASIDRFFAIANQADKLIWVSPSLEYDVALLHKRNEFMVDHSELVIAVWNGKEKGGTFSCLKYARSLGRPIVRIDPTERRMYTMR